MPCAPAGRRACWVVPSSLRSFRWGHVRQLPPQPRCSPAPGRTERDPAPRRSRSTSTRRSARPTASPRRVPATTATRARALSSAARGGGRDPADGAGEGRATPPAAPPTSCVRRWRGCATPNGDGDPGRRPSSGVVGWRLQRHGVDLRAHDGRNQDGERHLRARPGVHPDRLCDGRRERESGWGDGTPPQHGRGAHRDLGGVDARLHGLGWGLQRHSRDLHAHDGRQQDR